MQRDKEILDCWRSITSEGSPHAFNRLFSLTNARLMRFCRQYINDREAAEEIVSDVFIYCWTERAKLSDVKNPEVFMFVAVKNRAINSWKKASHMQLVPIDEELENLPDTYRADLALERKEVMRQLEKAVDSLPDQCRIIFKLVKEDGMKCAEVAEILNISVRTVHAQVYRAMNKLNSIMRKHNTSASGGIIRDIASSIAIVFFYFFLQAVR